MATYTFKSTEPVTLYRVGSLLAFPLTKTYNTGAITFTLTTNENKSKIRQHGGAVNNCFFILYLFIILSLLLIIIIVNYHYC